MRATSSAKSASRSRWAASPADIGKTIHPHPTLGESIGMTAELFEGVCTDLPPARKK
jgi:dihydrolipoamide dehydrogenase